MPRQERARSKSGFYHIMIWGNERKFIFNDNDDKQRFIEILGDTKKENRFDIVRGTGV